MKISGKLSEDNRVTILALSWRDIKAPTAGGAEVHTHEMLKRLNHNKYRVIHFAPLYKGEEREEAIDGVQYIRKGNIISVIWYAFLYYKKNRKKIKYVIDQCNTHRFFTPLWVEHKKRIFYIHQLTREIWDINLKFPFSKIGKALESVFLRLNRKDYAITVSESTRQELVDLGFDRNKIIIVHNGISFDPWFEEQMYEKEEIPTFIYVGRYAYYKGIDAAVMAIGKLHQQHINACLWILGKKNEEYVEKKLKPICEKYNLKWGDGEKGCDKDIISWGFVSEEKKLELLSRATALLFPSIREGWGIPITEAGVVGTPSIVYNSPGIRDAVDGGKAGYLCQSNSVEELMEMMRLSIDDAALYQEKKQWAYDFSKEFRWDKTGKVLEQFLDNK